MRVDTSRAVRRGAIDLARIGALVLVVAGHLTLAVIDRGSDGALRGVNLISLHPGWAWLAALAPMPLFFAAAGWANATSAMPAVAARLRSLVGLAAVVVVAWAAAAAVAALVAGEPGLVGRGARVATQPIWFLAAYVPFAATGEHLARIARRPVVAIGGCLAALAGLDALRFGLDLPGPIGWAGFALAWVVPWLAGAAWRRRWETGAGDERRIGWLLIAGAAAAAIALVGWFEYRPTLIDAVAGWRSNTTPPTLYTAVAGLAQVGLLMVVAGALDRIAHRIRGLLDRAGEAAVAVYLWHLTALALAAGLLAAGLWAPTRFDGWWWLSRPGWWGFVLGLTALLVGATLAGRAVLRRHPARHPRGGAGATWVGVVASTAGAAVVGLEGPGTAGAGLAACSLLLAGWWLLGAAGVRPDGRTGSRDRPTTPAR